jgi:hypothetical protein
MVGSTTLIHLFKRSINMNVNWASYITIVSILNCANGLFAVRMSDNVLDPGDWPISIIKIDSGCVIEQVNVIEKTYSMPDMKGWTLKDLYNWLMIDTTGSHPEEYHDIAVIEKWK